MLIVVTFMLKPLKCFCARRHSFRYLLYTLTLAPSIFFFHKFVSSRLKDDLEVLVQTRKKIRSRRKYLFKAKEDLRGEAGEGTKWCQNSQAAVIVGKALQR